jgi:drug/metabolite transporter superfamily protein YnfA
MDLQHVALIGAALGGVLGLVPDRSPGERIGGFLVGFAAAWIGFAIRAAVLPDSASGRAVAAFIVIAVCLLLAAAMSMTPVRPPLWSMLVGVAAIVGAYEEMYTSAPSQFLSDSPTAATTVLLAVSLGYLATSVLGPQVQASRERTDAAVHRDDLDDPSDSRNAGVDSLLTDKAN